MDNEKYLRNAEPKAEELDAIRKALIRKAGRADSWELGMAIGSISARLIQTHAAIRLLAAEGLAVEAGVLLRSMIEGTMRLCQIYPRGKREAARYLSSTYWTRRTLLHKLMETGTEENRSNAKDALKKLETWKSEQGAAFSTLTNEGRRAIEVNVRSVAAEIDMPIAIQQWSYYSDHVHVGTLSGELFVYDETNPNAVSFDLRRRHGEAAQILASANGYYWVVLDVLNRTFHLDADDAISALRPLWLAWPPETWAKCE